MTSEAKLAANRHNARKSTGPRGAAAKARTRFNAWRHGLAAVGDVAMAAQLEPLARQFANGARDPRELGAARIAAQAQLELARVRKLKVDLLERAVRDVPADGSLTKEEQRALAFADQAKALAALDRYERRALSRRSRALRDLGAIQKANREKTTPFLPVRQLGGGGHR
jgi:hypothetical protein